MTWFFVIATLAVAIVLSGFFSGSETGLYCVNRLRLQLGVQRRDARSIRLARLLSDERSALSVVLIGTNAANYLATAAAAFLFSDLLGVSDQATEIYTVLALTPVLFVFGEIVPKNLFQMHADTLMTRGSRAFAVATTVIKATGAVWAAKWASEFLLRALPIEGGDRRVAEPKRRMAALLREAMAGDTLGETQSEFVDGVVLLSETSVASVMVPRNRVVTISAKATRRELTVAARRSSHTRLPVRDQHARRVIGVIKVDDLLTRDDWTTIADGLRPITTLTPHQSVASAITELQRARHPMAVVTDRTGHMLGIVTLKDLVEELVGELTAW